MHLWRSKPWIPLLLILALLAGYVFSEIRFGGATLGETGQLILEFFFLILLVGAMYWFWWQQSLQLQDERKNLELARQEIQDIRRRLDAVFRLNRISVEAADEREMVNQALQMFMELTGARGATFVPLDDRGQPEAAMSLGEAPVETISPLVEYLASPEVHGRCRACKRLGAVGECPLLEQFSGENLRVYCFPLTRGEFRYGMLNLYLPLEAEWLPDVRYFMQAMVDEFALALEGVRLRQRELMALRQLQRVRARSGLEAQLNQMLEDVRVALDADFATLMLKNTDREKTVQRLVVGRLPAKATPLVLDCLERTVNSMETVFEQRCSLRGGIYSLIALPLTTQENEPLGGILVANRRSQEFQPRQLTLLQTMAGQISLVLHNGRLMEQLEYQAVMAERSRLAHEIHDGLAQTLAFLKLQIAQLRQALEAQDTDRLLRGIHLSYETVSGAYEDVREAIDDLFSVPGGHSFGEWLQAVVQEFSEQTGIAAEIRSLEKEISLPPTVQIQLIRIVQEALSNVRKHAQASRVSLLCERRGKQLTLEISDDGRGFLPEQVDDFSRHGLRGMRERADSIQADFQVISRAGEGTTIRLQLLLNSSPVEL
ncbi:MAG: GAF domain-containing protein [Anaerolineae bacterium]|nr:MAG: GAF domain-containing protein [Anaerolineae bacterium]